MPKNRTGSPTTTEFCAQGDYKYTWPLHEPGAPELVDPHMSPWSSRVEAGLGGMYRSLLPQSASEGPQIPNIELLEGVLKIQREPFAIGVKSKLQDVLPAFIHEWLAVSEFEGRLARDIVERLGGMEQKIEQLVSELASRPITSVATLYDLGAAGLGLAQPVQIVIEQYDEEITATWPEIQAFGSGSSTGEAILALKRDIVGLYSDLHSTVDGELGTLALAWKRTLEKVVVPDGTPERQTA